MLYYTAGLCMGTPLMRLDIARTGYVSQGTLYYPTGSVLQQTYNAFHDGKNCFTSTTGQLPLATVGFATVTGIPLPLSITK